MTEYVHTPFANRNHDDAIWGVQFCGWVKMRPLFLHHCNNYCNSKHLLSSYYVSNTVLRALHGLSHFQ